MLSSSKAVFAYERPGDGGRSIRASSRAASALRPRRGLAQDSPNTFLSTSATLSFSIGLVMKYLAPASMALTTVRS